MHDVILQVSSAANRAAENRRFLDYGREIGDTLLRRRKFLGALARRLGWRPGPSLFSAPESSHTRGADRQLRGAAHRRAILAIRRAFRRIPALSHPRRHTPHSYRNLLRIERARELLARGAAAAEIASDLGFADQAHFSRRFKRVVGLTPSSYARATRRMLAGSLRVLA
jgi:hypothetical protein